MNALRTLRAANGWVVLLTAAIALIGCTFIRSATLDDPDYQALYVKQLVVVLIAAGSGLALVLIPYTRLQRYAWLVYGGAVVALLLLPVFGIVVNGARRWYRLPGFFVQPSEFAKLAVILALASYLRFRSQVSAAQSLWMPALIAAVPAALVLRQPDLGSSLVFVPVVLAMCFAAGASLRALGGTLLLAAVLMLVSYFVLHDYQRTRIDVWLDHFRWDEVVAAEAAMLGGRPLPEGFDEAAVRSASASMQQALRDPAYQPWQALIAIGSGGWSGFGLQQGPQNRYGFLPYRFDDYIFAVVAEEGGFLGACMLLGLVGLLVAGLLGIALRTRERFGRLVAVGVAAYLGSQSLMHVAVCSWLVPATGLPMPLVSYGGSSTLVSVWAVALVVNVSAHRAPVLASDGFA